MLKPKKRSNVPTPYGMVTSTTTGPVTPTTQPILRDLTADECARKEAGVLRALEMARVFGVLVGDAAFLTAAQLDDLYDHMLANVEPEENFRLLADTFGFALGECLVQVLKMRWAVVTDEYGTDFAVNHDQAHVMSCPVSVVEKRLEDGAFRFFVPVTYVLGDEISRMSKHWNAPEEGGAA